MPVRAKQANLTTSLAVKQCAEVFQEEVANARKRGLMRDVQFFTPEDTSPFSVLDDDPAHFTVGAIVPNRGIGRRMAGLVFHDWDSVLNPETADALQMYIWDRQSHREVGFYAPHGATKSRRASALLETVIGAFQGLDNRCEVVV